VPSRLPFLKNFEKKRDRGVLPEENKLDELIQIDQAVAGSTCIAESSSHLILGLCTRVDPVLLRGLRFLVILEDMNAILVGRDLLKAPGIGTHEMLTTKVSAGLISPKLHVSGIPSIFSESGMKSESFDQRQDQHTILIEGGYSQTLAQSSAHDSDDLVETHENSLGDKLQDALEGMIERAGRVLDTEPKAKLRNPVYEFVDVWRVALSSDGPVKVTPFKVHLKHDAVPRRERSRRYAVDHRN